MRQVSVVSVASVCRVLLGGVILVSGCKNAPQPQASGTSGGAVSEGYNRSYQNEARHRHRHGKGEEAQNDNWASYEREGTAEGSAGGSDAGSYEPRRAGSGNRREDGGVATTAAGGTNYQSSNRRQNGRAMNAAPGQFDFYLLNLSWSPEFCHGHTATECALHRAFTLHGLWPQNNDGTYPEDCSEEAGPSTPSQYADIYPDPALLQHEWQTHGTCSGLGPDLFLALARRAEQSVQIPVELAHQTQEISMSPMQLTALFTQSNPSLPASSVAISCGNNYLTAVEVCMDKNLKPESCLAVKTCGASQIRIPAPQ